MLATHLSLIACKTIRFSQIDTPNRVRMLDSRRFCTQHPKNDTHSEGKVDHGSHGNERMLKNTCKTIGHLWETRSVLDPLSKPVSACD